MTLRYSGGSELIKEYIDAALSRAKYEIIEDEEPYYGEVPELEGVWATGKTLEECRNNLAEVIDGWLVVRLKRGLAIPPLGKHTVRELKAKGRWLNKVRLEDARLQILASQNL
jgi:predicted RNase H-like HicB family nuclease